MSSCSHCVHAIVIVMVGGVDVVSLASHIPICVAAVSHCRSYGRVRLTMWPKHVLYAASVCRALKPYCCLVCCRLANPGFHEAVSSRGLVLHVFGRLLLVFRARHRPRLRMITPQVAERTLFFWNNVPSCELAIVSCLLSREISVSSPRIDRYTCLCRYTCRCVCICI